MGVKLVTDSACDLTAEYVKQNSDILHILPCYIEIQNETLIDDFGISYDLDKFYCDIRAGHRPRTSMVTPNRFADLYTELTKQGHEIVYVGFSGQLSGVHNSSILASVQVKEKFPDARIYIVDTTCASIGLGVICDEAIKMVRSGLSGEKIAERLEAMKQSINHWFAVDGMKFLKEGGRITPMVAMIGTALNIKPLLTVDRIGRIVLAGKVRGRKKSIEYLAEKTINHYDSDYNSMIIIGHGDAKDDAMELERLVRKKLPEASIMNIRMHITIATHVGPGTLAIAFYGKEREE